MEIKYRSDDTLIVCDDLKEISFSDLAKIHGYQLEGNPIHNWVIYQYKELINYKKIEFGLGTAYHCPSGNLALLYFGYFLNDINRRTIELNEDGTVRKDTIILFNPRYILETDYFYSSSPTGVKLEEYLSNEQVFYENYNKTEKFKNRILDDKIIEKYLYYNNFYCNLLNHYSDNYEMVKNIFGRLDDEWYLKNLELDIKNSKSSSNSLERKLNKN